MKYLFVFVLAIWGSCVHAQTFEEMTDAFPLGTNKESILAKEPSASSAPCVFSPINPSARRESLVLMKSAGQSRLVVQFFLINNTLSAMMLAQRVMPGAPIGSEVGYVSAKEMLGSFAALRIDNELNPVEVKVEKHFFDKPNHVALIVTGSQGSELWIVDEKVFAPKAFFMEPSKTNQSKLLDSKKAIDAQRGASEQQHNTSSHK